MSAAILRANGGITLNLAIFILVVLYVEVNTVMSLDNNWNPKRMTNNATKTNTTDAWSKYVKVIIAKPEGSTPATTTTGHTTVSSDGNIKLQKWSSIIDINGRPRKKKPSNKKTKKKNPTAVGTHPSDSVKGRNRIPARKGHWERDWKVYKIDSENYGLLDDAPYAVRQSMPPPSRSYQEPPPPYHHHHHDMLQPPPPGRGGPWEEDPWEDDEVNANLWILANALKHMKTANRKPFGLEKLMSDPKLLLIASAIPISLLIAAVLPAFLRAANTPPHVTPIITTGAVAGRREGDPSNIASILKMINNLDGDKEDKRTGQCLMKYLCNEAKGSSSSEPRKPSTGSLNLVSEVLKNTWLGAIVSGMNCDELDCPSEDSGEGQSTNGGYISPQQHKIHLY